MCKIKVGKVDYIKEAVQMKERKCKLLRKLKK